jgi:hypothetical protein
MADVADVEQGKSIVIRPAACLLACLLAFDTAPAAAQSPGPVAGAPDAVTAARWRQRWGFYLDMLDRPYVGIEDSSGLVDASYQSVLSWVVPGESMSSKVVRVGSSEAISSRVLQWNPATGRVEHAPDGSGIVAYQQIQPDGAIVSMVEAPVGDTRLRIRTTNRMVGDGVVEAVTEQDQGSGWQVTSRSKTAPVTAANVARADAAAADAKRRRQADEDRKAAIRKQALQAAFYATPEELARFGLLARLAGTAWAFDATPTTKYGEFRAVTRFAWNADRSAVEIEDSSVGESHAWKATPTGKPGELRMVGGLVGSDVQWDYLLQPAGTDRLASPWTKRWGSYYTRVIIALLPNGKVAFQEETAERGKLPSLDAADAFLAMAAKEPIPVDVSDQLVAGNKATGKKIIAEVNAQLAAEERARRQASAERWNRIVGTLVTVLDVANEVYSERVAQSQAALDATLAQARNPSPPPGAVNTGQGITSAGKSASPVAGASMPSAANGGTTNRGGSSGDTGPGQPLRFVLSISMRNLPGDTVNPTCYSNLITRPGPPGWGQPGFLPPGSAEQARSEVFALKDAFIAQCRQSGRDITSEGNFFWVWNELKSGESQLAAARARYREDVTVSLQ